MKTYLNKGISLVSVLIIVVILSIITSVATISLNSILDDTYEKEFITEYNLVKSSMKDYIVRNSGYINFESIEFDISNIPADCLNQFDGENINDNKIVMYPIKLEEIGVYNASYGNKVAGNELDVYAISKDKNNVYYLKGFKIDNKIHYKM